MRVSTAGGLTAEGALAQSLLGMGWPRLHALLALMAHFHRATGKWGSSIPTPCFACAGTQPQPGVHHLTVVLCCPMVGPALRCGTRPFPSLKALPSPPASQASTLWLAASPRGCWCCTPLRAACAPRQSMQQQPGHQQAAVANPSVCPRVATAGTQLWTSQECCRAWWQTRCAIGEAVGAGQEETTTPRLARVRLGCSASCCKTVPWTPFPGAGQAREAVPRAR